MTNDQTMRHETSDQAANNPLQIEETLNENEHRPFLFYLVLGILLLIIAIGGIIGYLCYPFPQKIAGSWESADKTMTLTSQGEKWELAIPNYKKTKGLTVIYTGVWTSAGVNKYDGKQVKLLSKIEKTAFSKEELVALQKKSDLYTISAQKKNELILQYTKKGIKQIQSISDLNTVVHMTLENIHWNKKEEKLYLNSSYFSTERIEFAVKNEK